MKQKASYQLIVPAEDESLVDRKQTLAGAEKSRELLKKKLFDAKEI